jgi:hypothetical protein
MRMASACLGARDLTIPLPLFVGAGVSARLGADGLDGCAHGTDAGTEARATKTGGLSPKTSLLRYRFAYYSSPVEQVNGLHRRLVHTPD